MDPTATRTLGRTGVDVTQLGLGGASYGELFHRVSELDAYAAIQAAWDGGVRYFDTAPWYGRGLSELRTGAGLRDKPREEYVLSTKIGRVAQGSPGPGVRSARRGSVARRSRSSSTTPMTASCAPTSRASCASAWRATTWP